MSNTGYETRRGELATYFDKTAVDKWKAITSNSPVSRIRETVRAGRDEMRTTLLDWLPHDLTGMRILDAGCGPGQLAVEMARRGAEIVAVDLSPNLIQVAIERTPSCLDGGKIDYLAGDMTSKELGAFDYVVAMDSLIHYPMETVVKILADYSPRVRRGILFSFAPRTPLLAAMHNVGKLFPRNDRSPAIVPIAEAKLKQAIGADGQLTKFDVRRTLKVDSGFYKSQALELQVR